MSKAGSDSQYFQVCAESTYSYKEGSARCGFPQTLPLPLSTPPTCAPCSPCLYPISPPCLSHSASRPALRRGRPAPSSRCRAIHTTSGCRWLRRVQTTKRGEMQELKEELNVPNKDKQKEAVKKVVAAMTVGKDVSVLCPEVIKCMQTNNIELKKLVYLYLINCERPAALPPLPPPPPWRAPAVQTHPAFRCLGTPSQSRTGTPPRCLSFASPRQGCSGSLPLSLAQRVCRVPADAKSQPDLAILAVNTFVKDSADLNPLIRALAVRTMGCIRVDKISEYLCDPLRKVSTPHKPSPTHCTTHTTHTTQSTQHTAYAGR